jgi:hypothetical protein
MPPLFDFATGGTVLGMGKKRKTKQNCSLSFHSNNCWLALLSVDD